MDVFLRACLVHPGASMNNQPQFCVETVIPRFTLPGSQPPLKKNVTLFRMMIDPYVKIGETLKAT